MSTFKGYVEEFPDIRIDYFRSDPDRRQPLAFFLSHVHSDHLQGLDAFRGRFIYCSPATRILLLHLEKYSHRMNFQKGILEATVKDYRGLQKVLKTIPLNAPADIELSPGRSIRVTLLDANHCAGAVMFLIEDGAKAILYTGDIRAEPWWVNALIRNPTVIPFQHGKIRRLNKIYLDTTFATRDSIYKEFPSKAEGLSELLEKVSRYPSETVFHVHAWTLGYEDVWVALSNALQSRIHVDDYKCRLYKPLAAFGRNRENPTSEGAALFGFPCGNHDQYGCLTDNQEVRLHSCEPGSGCPAQESPDTVMITPIITRSAEGRILPEIGAGGGGGDLNRTHELDLNDQEAVRKLVDICSSLAIEPQERSKMMEVISKAVLSDQKTVSLDMMNLADGTKSMSLADIGSLLSRLASLNEYSDDREQMLDPAELKHPGKTRPRTSPPDHGLSKRIVFPYSRHASYSELCHLVDVFRPLDVYPCTIDEQTWSRDIGVESLFGRYCAGDTFVHDKEMEMLNNDRVASRMSQEPRISAQGYQANGSSDGISKSQSSRDDHHPLQQPVQLKRPDRQPQQSLEPDRTTKRPRINGVLRQSESQNDLLPLGDGPVNPRKFRGLRRNLENRLTTERQDLLARTVSDPTSKISTSAVKPSRPPFSVHHVPPIASSKEKESISSRTLKVASIFNGTATNGSDTPIKTSVHNMITMDTSIAGTQAAPLELSDEDDDTTADEDEDGDGSFLLEDMPEPENTQKPQTESQPGTESTQLSLSDAAFESQSSRISGAEVGKPRLQDRKEVYKATREQGGTWSAGFGLVSVGAGHADEEVEL